VRDLSQFTNLDKDGGNINTISLKFDTCMNPLHCATISSVPDVSQAVSFGMTKARDQIYMLDTNVFNDVLDGKISPEVFAGHRLFVIGVQIDEIQATKKIERRESLLAVFKDIAPTSLLASSFAREL
jgi:hypothetical protein